MERFPPSSPPQHHLLTLSRRPHPHPPPSQSFPTRLFTTTTSTMSPASDPDKNSDILKWADNGGEFKRQVSAFRDVIEEGGKFAPEKGRYHLYVSLACEYP